MDGTESGKGKLFLSVIGEGGDVEYNISKELYKGGTIKYSLFTSSSSVWNENFRNKFIFGIVNTGNGIRVIKPKSLYRKRRNSFLEYDEAAYMFLLLSIDNKDCGNSMELTVVERPSGETYLDFKS